MKHVPYQLVVGSLMYAMVCTRLNICFEVVSRHLSNPNKQHWIVVKCIMRYLQGTLTQGITYRGNLISKESQIQLVAYTDFDWVGNANDRRYSTKYCFNLLGGAISWSNKR
jgi:hypothetical protein